MSAHGHAGGGSGGPRPLRWSPDPYALGAGSPRAGPRVPEAALRPDGGGWRLAFDGRSARLPALAGLADLCRLVARPGEPVHCLDLADLWHDGGSGAGPGERGDRARRALEAGMRELHEELAEAGASRDPCRRERARAELDHLAWALSDALGLDGGAPAREDAADAAAARVRDAVIARIRHALRKVEAVLPALGRHLAESVATGTLCVYRPARPVRWRIGPGERPEA